jgi:hypothetical protein
MSGLGIITGRAALWCLPNLADAMSSSAPPHGRCLAARTVSRVEQRGNLCGWLQVTRNPFLCFEQALIALSFSQKFLTFRSRLIFFSRLNFSGDRLIQFIDGPVRYWLPAHGGILAVANYNTSSTGCPTFTRQRTKLNAQKKNLSISLWWGRPHRHRDYLPVSVIDPAPASGVPNGDPCVTGRTPAQRGGSRLS